MGPTRGQELLTARGGGTLAEPAGGQAAMGAEAGTILATLGKSGATLVPLGKTGARGRGNIRIARQHRRRERGRRP